MSSFVSCLTCCCCCCCCPSRHKEVLPCRTPVYTTAASILTSSTTIQYVYIVIILLLVGFVLAFTALYLGDWYTCFWNTMDLTTTWTGEVLLRFGLTSMKLSRDDGPFVQYKSMKIVDACDHMVDTHSSVTKSDCEAADALLVTNTVTGTCFIIFTSFIALCTAATFLVTGTSRFGYRRRLSAMTVEPNRADKAMVHVKRATAIVAIFITLILSSIISLFPAKVFGKYVCPVTRHVLPFVVNPSTAASTTSSVTGESHHAGASAYLALVACLFFLCACVFILSRMAIVSWCMELCGEVEFEMEYESEDEENAFDDGHNGGKNDPCKVDANEGDECGPGGRRARLEGVVVYDPVGMKSHKGRGFESDAADVGVDDIVVDKNSDTQSA